MRYFVKLGAEGEEIAVDVLARGDGTLEVRVDGAVVTVEASDAGAATCVRVGERVLDVWLDAPNGSLAAGEPVRFVAGGARGTASLETERSRIGGRGSRPGGGRGGEVRAPMPGRVVKVLVAEGDVVAAGAPLVVVEAMKMENELCAPAAGVVRGLRASAGQTVEGGATLIELGPLDS